MRKLNLTYAAVLILLLAFSAFFLGWKSDKITSYNFEIGQKVNKPSDANNTNIPVDNNQSSSSMENPSWQKSPLSGKACADAERRPIAVVLAGDDITRPLSGLAEADIIIEIPVITDGINRLVTFYVCGNPSEIGSIRSARHDFIPLTMGMDAILAHWGGSHFALDKLRAGMMDNIDALPNPYSAFWRKSGVPAPHNGFTSIEKLLNAAKNLGYRLENNFAGYLFYNESEISFLQEEKSLTIGYPGPFNVEYRYQPKDGTYLRFRGSQPEIDKLSGGQIQAKNVVIMKASSRQIEGQYNDVAIEGEGKAEIYQAGSVVKGVWRKDKSKSSSKLYFFNREGLEVKFVPGQIWIEIVGPEQKVEWK